MENSIYEARWLLAPDLALPAFFLLLGALFS